MPDWYLWTAVAVMAVVTAALRFLPFLIWNGKRQPPKLIEKLGKALPAAVMGLLVVYCLKGTGFAAPAQFLPPLIASAVVAGLYVWKRNTLVSILAGTVCYMLLVQVVF